MTSLWPSIHSEDLVFSQVRAPFASQLGLFESCFDLWSNSSGPWFLRAFLSSINTKQTIFRCHRKVFPSWRAKLPGRLEALPWVLWAAAGIIAKPLREMIYDDFSFWTVQFWHGLRTLVPVTRFCWLSSLLDCVSLSKCSPSSENVCSALETTASKHQFR